MIRAALFDKDGTLIDFHRTWDAAVGIALRGAAPDAAALGDAAELLRFDLESNTIGPDSALIADSNQQVIDLIRATLDVTRFGALLNTAAVDAAAPSAGMPQVLHELRDLGVELVVVTNDFEEPTRRQLDQLGWTDLFSHVVGSDSGYGAKPNPGMVNGALALCGVGPTEAVMIGDTEHDLRAGRAAGVATVLVTNNQTPSPKTESLADLIVPDLTELLSALRATNLLSPTR